MARAIDQIISELDASYNPQRQVYQTQIDALPAYQQTQQAGLDQAKTNAFGDINSNANAKGMYYSGMPITEQARYTGATYLPAVANLAKSVNDQKFSLQSSLSGLTQKEYGDAQSIRQTELDRDEKIRQAELDRQAQLQAAAVRTSSGGSSRSSGGGSAKAPSMQEIINYWKTAPSQYGAYNANSTNLHRWQAAAAALADAGYSTVHNSAADKLLRSVFNQGR